jgi:hypothetical protein
VSAKEHKKTRERKNSKKGQRFLSLEKKRNVVTRERRRRRIKHIKRELSSVKQRAHTHAPLAFDGFSISTFSSSSFIFIYVYKLKMRNSFFASKKKKSEERKTKKNVKIPSFWGSLSKADERK